MRSYKERESTVFAGLVTVLLVTWLGFLVHRSPGFPGSLAGHAIGIVGASMMLVPLLYLVVKRVNWVKRVIIKRWPMRTLLAWHIYAGILGPILVLVHTGHRFESALGIALTSTTLVVAISGFVGRFLMKRIQGDLHELEETMDQLEGGRASLLAEIGEAVEIGGRRPRTRAPTAIWLAFFTDSDADAAPPSDLARRAVRLAEAQADIETAVGVQRRIKWAFGHWLRVHIVISLVLYILMGLHVWATIHFGLRWLS